jgi:glycosyltransferase involved in cell wall biosynthesis
MSDKRTAAIFCFEEPQSPVGQFAASAARILSSRGYAVLLFSRASLDVDLPGVVSHAIGDVESDDLVGEVRAFTLRASALFNAALPAGSENAVLIGCEWSSIPSLQILGAMRQLPSLLCLYTLERQRSDMASAISRQIEEIEIQGLHQAKAVLANGGLTVDLARKLVPDFALKISALSDVFPVENFRKPLDAGAVKAQYQIGPVDPVVLYFGVLDEDHGPDLLMKAVPFILKKHPKAHFVFVGDGPLFWMLRIYARYLNLESAVRVAGHLAGEALHELIQASDILVVPSRKPTETWPIQAAWAAGKAVIATHETAGHLITHEQNGVLIYPLSDSCAWGVDRVLTDPYLWGRTVDNGRIKLASEFGENALAEQLSQVVAQC